MLLKLPSESCKVLVHFLSAIHEFCSRVLLRLRGATLVVYAIDPYDMCEASLEIPLPSSDKHPDWDLHTYLDPIRKACTGGSLKIHMKPFEDHLVVHKVQRKVSESVTLEMERLEDVEVSHHDAKTAGAVVPAKELSRVAHTASVFGRVAEWSLHNGVTMVSANTFGSISYDMPSKVHTGKRPRVSTHIRTKHLKCLYIASGNVQLDIREDGFRAWSKEGHTTLRWLFKETDETPHHHRIKRRRVQAAA